MSFVDVVVVNWNSGGQLEECINSIISFGAGFFRGVIVVDNGSIDNSELFLHGQPDVKLIQTGQNLGFGAACNLGARQAKSEYLLFLNPDAALLPDTLEKVFAFMRHPENTKIGICGVQLKDESGHVARSCARFPSFSSLIMHAVGVDRFFPKLGYSMSDWDHGTTARVDHVIGAFYLMRRSAFEEVGGFDERFFVYLEDLDLSLRVAKAGWSTVYYSEAQAFHAGGGTSKQIKARRLFYSLRSRLIYTFKHFSLPLSLTVLLVTLFVEPLSRSAHSLVRGSWSGFKETWAAFWMLWSWLPQWIFWGLTK